MRWPWRRTETRAASLPTWLPPIGRPGGYVNPIAAENLATVSACVAAICSGVASLPPLLYRKEGAGRIEVANHPVARILHAPNEHQTWNEFAEWLVAQTLLRGNGLATIDYDRAGRPTALNPVPWDAVAVSQLASGRIAYDVSRFALPGGWAGPPVRYIEDDVLHLRDRSDDGLIGRSRLSRAAAVVGNASLLQEYTEAAWLNGGTPSGAVEVSGPLSADARERLRSRLGERVEGPHNARRILILESGATFRPLNITAEDAQVIESRRFSTEELCRLFQVPPPIVQDYTHNTFTNSQQASRWFAMFSLAPWVSKLEARLNAALLPPDYQIELDMSGLLRGDPAERWQAWKIARETGILSADEIRAAEGYGPGAPAAPSG